MPTYTQNVPGTRIRINSGPSAEELACEIKTRIDIPTLAEKLFPGWKSAASCKSPFREDNKPSFSVYAHGTRWKDHASGDGGDIFDFYQLATGCDCKQAFIDLKQMALGSSKHAPIIRASKPRPEEKKNEQHHPELSIPTDNDLLTISQLRSIGAEALKIASDRGLLYMATIKGNKSWLLTDKTRKAYNARRLDGKPWDHLPDKPKALLLYRSSANWPIGVQEASDFPSIAVCEGVPDFLAAFGLAYASGIEHLVGPVCMSSASVRIPAEALPFFQGKRVRIFVHEDARGMEAAERWSDQLAGIASKIDGFEFSDLITREGSPVTDLNDMLKSVCGNDKDREIITSAMNFAKEGAN
jgi:hypothetical protein